MSGKFSLEVATENRVALLRHSPIECLKTGRSAGQVEVKDLVTNHPVVSKVRHSNGSDSHQRNLSFQTRLPHSVFVDHNQDVHSFVSLQNIG